MQTRVLGNSDLHITPLGVGAWAMGGAGWEYGWGAQDDDLSVRAIHRALELGVNWIDTAPAYGLGHAEQVVARALAAWRGPRPYVFTKCGLAWDEGGRVSRDLRPESIRRECEASLSRLRVDVLDLFQIHWPVEEPEALDAAWETVTRLREEGKVRWAGVSNYDAGQIRRAEAIAPVTSLQPPYSLVHREVEAEVLPHCRSHGIGVIVYAPMASGLLTGAMTRERATRLPEDDWRRRSADFNEPRLSRNLALVGRLRAVGTRHGRSPGEVAIAWTLRNPAVTGAIVGIRSPEQADGVLRAAEIALGAEDVAEIEAFSGKPAA
jgi:aryl-alcohol dehydrogenase-like predicted oxidoreductase